MIFFIKYFGARTSRACFVNTNCMALNLTLRLRALYIVLSESRVAVINTEKKVDIGVIMEIFFVLFSH